MKTQSILLAALLAFAALSHLPAALGHASANSTLTVTTNKDHADLVTPDATSDGVCNDTVSTITFGMITIPVIGCSLRSAIKTSFETPSNDSVVFSPPLSGTVIALKGNAVNWAASGVDVDGQSQNIAISGAGMTAGQNMLAISGSGNTLRSLSLTAARQHAVLVGDSFGVGEGNNNTLRQLQFYGNINGIAVSVVGSGAGGGQNMVIEESVFGRPTGSVCEPERANSVGIRVGSGAARTRLLSNQIFCSDVAGIQVFDAATTGTAIRSNNIGNGLVESYQWGNGIGVHLQNAKITRIESNYIRSSIASGVYINGAGTNDIVLSGNTLGDIQRDTPVPLAGENGGDGLLVQAVPAAAMTVSRNAIQGNGRDGVRIENARQITVTENIVGYDEEDGVTFLARNINGVSLLGGAQQVRVLSNTIAYNENVGVLISGENSDGNGVAGNRIHSQQNTGLQIDGGADFNAIGAESFSLLGIVGVSGNAIYSNTREGIYITNLNTTNNLVVANRIGSADAAIRPNGLNGIVVADLASGTLIGGNVPGLDLRNWVGGNGANGILITGRANNTTVVGNAVGAAPDLWGPVPNGADGIRLIAGANNNSVGGPMEADQNTIANNLGDGIALIDATVTNNSIAGNRIAKNSGNGIGIYAATANTLGGTLAEPLEVHANVLTGVYLALGASGNALSNISADENGHYGLLLDNSTGNTLTAVSADLNGYDGIGERNGATNNGWNTLMTGQNGGLGIDKDANNDAANIAAASTITITAFTPGDGAMTLGGLAAFTSYEIYVAEPDPSGYGEGARVTLSFSTGAGTSANVTIPAADRVENCFTVLKTTVPSSEFSQTYCRLTPQAIAFAALPDRTLAEPLAFTVYATATSGLPVAFASLTPAVCTVTVGGAVSILGVGECAIDADQPGNATFGAAGTITRRFGVTKANQSIDFPAPADRPFGSAAFAPPVSATSGLAIALASTTPGVCTVNGATVTLLHAGVCSLIANQPGNAAYNAAMPIVHSFDVTEGTQTVTFAQPADVLVIARGVTLSASASSGLAVTFGGGTPGVCGIDSTGRVTVLGPGNCAVTAAQAGNGDYAAAPPVARTFAVRRAVLLPLAIRQ